MRKFLTLILVSTSLSGLSACATLDNLFQKNTADFELDDLNFTEAVYMPDQTEAEVTVINQINPLTMAGQLKPLRTVQTQPSIQLSPSAAILQANAAAAVQPAPDNYINAIQIYPYSIGALYQIYCAPKQVTDIALQPGEELTSVSAGDTVRWVLGDTVSGSGRSEQVHIFIKPIAVGLTTNLVITTSKRTYHLEMTSHSKTYMAAVSWRYPNEHFGRTRTKRRTAKSITSNNSLQGLQLERLQFRYEIKGDNPHWRPLSAFDDGRKVFIQFPGRLDQGEAPPLFVVGKNGKSQLVNYRIKGTYYIVDRLFAMAELRLGEVKQDVVRIVRTSRKRLKSRKIPPKPNTSVNEQVVVSP